jgi:serine protease SohB
MDFVLSYLDFLLKILTIFFAIAALMLINKKSTPGEGDDIVVKSLNDANRDSKLKLAKSILGKDFKQFSKAETARKKNEANNSLDRVFIIDFNGDIMAKGVKQLRKQITTLLEIANSTDEVVLRLKSPGGSVTGYGLAASQLARIRQQGLKLTICVDEVAASGGYMMAAVANQIIAAPFAVIGSIGVVLEGFNFHKVLDSKKVSYEQITAGKHKRTFSTFGEITPTGREKVKVDIESIHMLFKTLIKKYRPSLDIEAVATGEIWPGENALKIGLIDELRTSDEYIIELIKTKKVFQLKIPTKKSVFEKFMKGSSSIIQECIGHISNWRQLR